MTSGLERQLQALKDNNPNKLIDLTGKRFGRLVVVEREPRGGRSWWRCKCDCGGDAVSLSTSLRKGVTQSCGCIQRERTGDANKVRVKHGHSAGVESGKRLITPTYRSWKAMLERCRNPNAPNYRLYGGRGVSVCQRWLGEDGFANFLADMGDRPEDRTLDRIDVNGHYEPGNVRWATPKEQAQNRRTTPELHAIRLEALARGRSATNQKRKDAKATRAERK